MIWLATSIRSFVIDHFWIWGILVLIAFLKLCVAAALYVINADKGTFGQCHQRGLYYSQLSYYNITNSNLVFYFVFGHGVEKCWPVPGLLSFGCFLVVWELLQFLGRWILAIIGFLLLLRARFGVNTATKNSVLSFPMFSSISSFGNLSRKWQRDLIWSWPKRCKRYSMAYR
jgi:hypothetical protein